MKTADVVIIGAGVNGSSIAYNLVQRGLKKVVLLEKGLVASGGTGRSAAIVWQHYSHPELVKMVKRSVDIFHDFGIVFLSLLDLIFLEIMPGLMLVETF